MDHHRIIENPYRPGAGHMPPFLAGRTREQGHFRQILRQNFTNENILITGLRGMGKTVLLAQLRMMAEQDGWIWIGNDLSESSCLNEERLATRILTDISKCLGQFLASRADDLRGDHSPANDFAKDPTEYTFQVLRSVYDRTPGLPSDRLREVFLRLGSLLNKAKARGIIFAYDEAQCLSDHADRNEFPMSVLIETISVLQRSDEKARFLLVLCGLPQVYDALTETRTYTERMFNVISLERLSRDETYTALVAPLQKLVPQWAVYKELINKAVDLTRGYPYLVQFFGKELFDQLLDGIDFDPANFPSPSVLERLDSGLFAARWNKTTDKQREVLRLIASRAAESPIDFSAQEISELSQGQGDLTNTQAGQTLLALCERGLLYRTRHGRYAFTVPMSEMMIIRRFRNEQEVEESWLDANLPPQIPNLPVSGDAQKPASRWRRWFG